MTNILEQETLPLPKVARPIVIVGAGGIVRDAHLPAYRKADFPVVALVDPDLEKARALANVNNISLATQSLADAIRHAPRECIFDVAVPASALLKVLPLIPDGAAVLMQKPMGDTLEEAEAILALCQKKGLTAAVNFQLRWAPAMLTAMSLNQAGKLGTVHDMEVQVNVHQPWELWSFLATAPRLEILYHSIHYIDLVRSWLGDPQRVYARTVRSPRTPELAATKSVIVLDYGDWTRAYIATNHSHDFGTHLQRSYVQWEGTDAALRAQMGVNLNYPIGEPDSLAYVDHGKKLQMLPVTGNWFPDAFIGSMGSLQAYVDGVTQQLPTRVEDAIQTMRVVEAAYRSSEHGGESLAIEHG
ncbi:MAG TPA: Gfo/Idh/MocA family oxidoreductase [Acidobacteriaceae bacterium]|nr:Gfo/Idh/MocA family oxidoreductase [Acidobacteriaceae bacterium]